MMALICGVGRAGKTTYSMRFNDVIHADLMGHLPKRYDNVCDLVRTKEDVVVDGIYAHREERRKLVEAYNGSIRKCVWLNTPKSTVEERMLCDGIHIPERHFDFEPPTLDEGWDEIIIIRGDDNVERISREK